MLILPVGLSSLSLVHAMEADHHAHEQHQCEIYEAINSALIIQANSELFLSGDKSLLSLEPLDNATCDAARPRTRSPPFIA